jgi:hypothetical protein
MSANKLRRIIDRALGVNDDASMDYLDDIDDIIEDIPDDPETPADNQEEG